VSRPEQQGAALGPRRSLEQVSEGLYSSRAELQKLQSAGTPDHPAYAHRGNSNQATFALRYPRLQIKRHVHLDPLNDEARYHIFRHSGTQAFGQGGKFGRGSPRRHANSCSRALVDYHEGQTLPLSCSVDQTISL
jgi:hypothetical protein